MENSLINTNHHAPLPMIITSNRFPVLPSPPSGLLIRVYQMQILTNLDLIV